MLARFFVPLIACALSIPAAETQSMGGTWKLNLDRSTWGKRDKPTSSELKIEHQEPAIRYTGTIINANATDHRDYKFEGSIDGQPHPAEGPDGPGTMTIRRVNPYTTEWDFQSNDGKLQETSTVVVSRDGRELSRRIHRKGPEGDFRWTEVYEKQQ